MTRFAFKLSLFLLISYMLLLCNYCVDSKSTVVCGKYNHHQHRRTIIPPLSQSSTKSVIIQHHSTHVNYPNDHPVRYRRRQTMNYQKSVQFISLKKILPPKQAKPTSNRRSSMVEHSWKAALSGSIAGAVATTILYPLDAAKTLRQAYIASTATVSASTTIQSSSSTLPITSVYAALKQLIHQRTVYVGLGTAILGAIPSSALYFGAYETSKSIIGRTFFPTTKRRMNHHRHLSSKQQTQQQQQQQDSDDDIEQQYSVVQRCIWHSTSAAFGNIISSAIFVPKEVIKQQMQYNGGSILQNHHHTNNIIQMIQSILQKNNYNIISSFYIGYRATILRNIPSAALRFTLYEEFKRYVKNTNTNNTSKNKNKNHTWKLYVAGAAAGAIASGIMTPMDLIKTKLSTGTCPINDGVQGCIQHVIQQNGIIALWTGAGSRMISSALFSAIGFGTFETCQYYLSNNPYTSTKTLKG